MSIGGNERMVTHAALLGFKSSSCPVNALKLILGCILRVLDSLFGGLVVQIKPTLLL